MKSLDLPVCFDAHLSETAKLAHHVLAPKLPLEVETNTAANELFGSFGPGWGYEQPYAQALGQRFAPPESSDVHGKWDTQGYCS